MTQVIAERVHIWQVDTGQTKVVHISASYNICIIWTKRNKNVTYIIYSISSPTPFSWILHCQIDSLRRIIYSTAGHIDQIPTKCYHSTGHYLKDTFMCMLLYGITVQIFKMASKTALLFWSWDWRCNIHGKTKLPMKWFFPLKTRC